jgi:hypothetical protein
VKKIEENNLKKIANVKGGYLSRKTLWCKNEENRRDRNSHTWASLKEVERRNITCTYKGYDEPDKHPLK